MPPAGGFRDNQEVHLALHPGKKDEKRTSDMDGRVDSIGGTDDFPAAMLSGRLTGVHRVSMMKRTEGQDDGTVSRVCLSPTHGWFNAWNAGTARSRNYSFPCSTR
jgi:hypothetical protein